MLSHDPVAPSQGSPSALDESGKHQTVVPSLVRPGPSNLPADLTRFVGRDAEIAEVTRLLPSTRLLTLSGTGGVGKTRLALRVGAAVLATYRDGVWLVELAPVADPLLVPTTVARAIAIAEQPGRPVRDALVDLLRPKQLLLLLDNCEHVVQAAAALVETLLRACPHLRVLATSRRSLHVPGEITWRVPSLAAPPLNAHPTSESLIRFDSARLFLDRAREALPRFAITDSNASTIARICSHLDGIPLAVELAAAWVAVLSPDQIDARLGNSLHLLTGGSRTALPRQQTLRATLDWSFGLLAEPERLLFRRLAVFAGGWTLDAAEAIGAGDGIVGEDVLDLLAGLVDKSLVIADDVGGSVRYRFLETMREYGWEKLRAAGEEVAIRDRHVDWYAALADEGEPHLHGSEQAAWLARLEREHDNLRAALAWCLGGERDPATGLRLAGALAWFWRLRGHLSEGRQWLDRALAREPGPAASARTRALNGAGFLAFAQNDLDAAATLFEEGLELARERDDQAAVAWALHGLGRVAHGQGDYERANAVLDESLAAFRGRDDTGGTAYSLYFLANVARERDDYPRAIVLYTEALVAAREVGDTWCIAWTLIHRGTLHFRQGDVAQAEALYRESLLLSDTIRAMWGVSDCLWGLARVAAARGQPDRAARLVGADQVLVATLGTVSERSDRVDKQRGVAAARAVLGETRFEECAAEGRAMTLDTAITYALEIDAAAVRSSPGADRHATSASSMALTPREREVAVLIARGSSNRAIAAALVITLRTADTHVRNILAKLELHTRAQIAAWAAKHGLLTVGEHPHHVGDHGKAPPKDT